MDSNAASAALTRPADDRPAADVTPSATAADGAAADGAWMRGFHGMLVDVDGHASSSLRRLALSRRALGLGSMDVLVDLPQTTVDRRRPLGVNGERHVGRNASELDAAPTCEPVTEPLADFIDRQLGHARFLLLPNQGRAYAATKRALDLVCASLLLLLTWPVIVALMIIIRLDSPGPAIFRQTRVTRGGREFTFFKFRTMYVDARQRFPELYDLQPASSDFDDTYYKLADDPRNTRVGRWLRRTTLDELPNLVNVLLGDLSMVGPRPDLPELVRRYRPEELACLFTKAGLTGVAQVAGRSLLTVRERLTLDMRYVARQTLLLDIRILWRTVVVVLSGRGAF